MHKTNNAPKGGEVALGAIGTFEATRFATGRKNQLTVEVSGTKGSLDESVADQLLAKIDEIRGLLIDLYY